MGLKILIFLLLNNRAICIQLIIDTFNEDFWVAKFE